MSQQNEVGQAQDRRGSLEELTKFLKEFNTAMLVTVSLENQLRARPMAIQDPSEVTDADLWFVTADDTGKIDEINHEHQVCVCAYRTTDQAYISISARVRLDKNREEIKRLYKPDWKAWYGGGEDDPSLVLLKLTVEHAEYWEPKGGRPRVLFEMVKAVVTGEPADKNLNPPKRL